MTWAALFLIGFVVVQLAMLHAHAATGRRC